MKTAFVDLPLANLCWPSDRHLTTLILSSCPLDSIVFVCTEWYNIAQGLTHLWRAAAEALAKELQEGLLYSQPVAAASNENPKERLRRLGQLANRLYGLPAAAQTRGWLSWSYFRSFFVTPKVRTLLLGLDNSGKTTLLYRLRTLQQEFQGGHVRPSCHPTVETCALPLSTGTTVELHAVDLGGHMHRRRFYHDYFAWTKLFVFTVDAADPERLPEAKAELGACLLEADGSPFIIVATKIDRLGALCPRELIQALGLRRPLRGRQRWSLVMVSLVHQSGTCLAPLLTILEDWMPRLGA